MTPESITITAHCASDQEAVEFLIDAANSYYHFTRGFRQYEAERAAERERHDMQGTALAVLAFAILPTAAVALVLVRLVCGGAHAY
jgi:hypothetical protein